LTDDDVSKPGRPAKRAKWVRPVSATVAALLTALSGCTPASPSVQNDPIQQAIASLTSTPGTNLSQPTMVAPPTTIPPVDPKPAAVQPAPADPPTPTLEPATAVPTSPPTPAGRAVPAQTFYVAGTGVDGLSLRPEPASAQLIKVWKDGTELQGLGEERSASGRNWAKVKDPDTNIGWVATDFLSTNKPPTATPQPTARPTTAAPPPVIFPTPRPAAPALPPTPRPAAPVLPPTPRVVLPTPAVAPTLPPPVYPAPLPGAPGHSSHASHSSHVSGSTPPGHSSHASHASHASHVSGRR
jgi:hypothetical protein